VGPLVTKLAATGAAAAAAVVARRAVEYGWTYVRGEDPPSADEVGDDRELRDLLLWSAVLTGAVVVARKIASSKTEQLLGDDD
jgi:hypothetical protein